MMDLVVCSLAFAGSMIASLMTGRSMIWAMIVGLAALLWAGRRRGASPRELLEMSWRGARGSLIVVRVMLTIGVLTGLWRAAGTFALLTAWGLQLIAPGAFVLAAFLLSCMMSYAIGSSFGTAGTIGAALMALARSGGVDEIVAAGAILSGIYFGDRASPASSCANLVAAVTSTDLYGDLRMMMRTSLVPMALSLAFYTGASLWHPMLGAERALLTSLNLDFDLSPLVIAPTLIMLALPLFKVRISRAFLASIACAFACAVWLQRMSVASALSCAVFGYHAPERSVRAIFNGGGLVSMIELCVVLMISGAYSGICEGTRMLDGLHAGLERLQSRFGTFPVTLSIGTLSNVVFCNQTVGVMMTAQLLRRPYERRGHGREELAQDIANSTVPTAGLVPWCVGSSVPLAIMGVSPRAIPWAVYLWLLPLCYALMRRRWYDR